MTDIVVGAVILLILGSAGYHVRKQLKSGSPCMGCSGNCDCAGACAGAEEKTEE